MTATLDLNVASSAVEKLVPPPPIEKPEVP
jgi:hypothetical protein